MKTIVVKIKVDEEKINELETTIENELLWLNDSGMEIVSIEDVSQESYLVYNLDTDKEYYYMNDMPKKQALKTTYAIENGLISRLATDFEKLMNELDVLIKESDKCFAIGSLSVLKR